MKNKIKYFLFVIIISLLVAPAIQTVTKIINEKPLDGAYVLAKSQKFSIKRWFSGEYQEQFNQSFEDHVGFRSYAIRLRNQVDYTLFNTIYTNSVVFGKNDVLYQDFYIDAFLGKDFIGENIIKDKIEKLKYIQDELKKKGITLIFVIAPGKASFFPEYLPEWVNKLKRGVTNYDVCVNEMNEQNINLFDAKSYLLHVKDTSRYPIFPKCGTHWSGYAITLITDSLVKFMEKISGIEISNFHSENGLLTNKNLRFTDDDIGKSLNLIFDIPSWNMYYPHIVFDSVQLNNKVDILTLGDSFTQSFLGFYPYFPMLFGNNSVYWYYNRVVSWPDSLADKYIDVSYLNYKKEIELRKFVLIVSTEQNLKDLGFGFIERAYQVYNPDESIRIEEQIKFYERLIRGDANWFNSVKQKAVDRNISVDEMVRIDAKWMVDQEDQKRIKNSPE